MLKKVVNGLKKAYISNYPPMKNKLFRLLTIVMVLVTICGFTNYKQVQNDELNFDLEVLYDYQKVMHLPQNTAIDIHCRVIHRLCNNIPPIQYQRILQIQLSTK